MSKLSSKKYTTKRKTLKSSKKTTNQLSTNYLKFDNNTKIIEILEIFNKYYTVINNRIHQNSYQKAIYSLKRYPNEITKPNDVKDLEGIGKGMLDKIDHILTTGTHPDITSKNMLDIIQQHSNTLDNLLGFGPSLIIQLNRKHGIYTIQDLDSKMNNSNPLNLSHIAFLGWKYHTDLATPIPRSEITRFGSDLSNLITSDTLLQKYNLELELAGSYPSGKPASKDIDILIYYHGNPINLTNQITELIQTKYPIQIISKGSSKLMLLVKTDPKKPWRHLDIAIYSHLVKPYAQLYFTSGKVFNLKIRQHAKKMGYKLSDTGLYSIHTGRKISIPDPVIPNLFKKLNLDYKLYLTRY